MFTLYFVAFFLRCFFFCLIFIFSFILYPSCIFTLVHFSLFLPSFLLIHLSICDKKWESILKYTWVYHHFYMTCAHSQREKFYLLHIRKGRKLSRRCIYQEGEDIFLSRKPCFVLFYSMLIFLLFYMMLWVMFSIYALLFSSYRVYVLNIHTSLCYCAFFIACLDDHLLYYVSILVIFIWLFCVWSSCSYVSHLVYLIAIYLLLYPYPFITYFTLRV